MDLIIFSWTTLAACQQLSPRTESFPHTLCSSPSLSWCPAPCTWWWRIYTIYPLTNRIRCYIRLDVLLCEDSLILVGVPLIPCEVNLGNQLSKQMVYHPRFERQTLEERCDLTGHPGTVVAFSWCWISTPHEVWPHCCQQAGNLFANNYHQVWRHFDEDLHLWFCCIGVVMEIGNNLVWCRYQEIVPWQSMMVSVVWLKNHCWYNLVHKHYYDYDDDASNCR